MKLGIEIGRGISFARHSAVCCALCRGDRRICLSKLLLQVLGPCSHISKLLIGAQHPHLGGIPVRKLGAKVPNLLLEMGKLLLYTTLVCLHLALLCANLGKQTALHLLQAVVSLTKCSV